MEVQINTLTEENTVKCIEIDKEEINFVHTGHTQLYGKFKRLDKNKQTKPSWN